MTTYAAAIAARLQGREDEDMGKDESVWDDDDEQTKAAQQLADEIGARLNKLVDLVHERVPAAVPLHEQADADQLVHEHGAAVGRVAELERQLADAKYNAESFREQAESASKAHRQALDRIDELERELEAARQLVVRNSQACDELLAAAYVTREVPWTDVAAGMMTIARDGTPWMVDQVCDNDDVELRNAGRSFMKTPAPGETVRVLVPYMTDEQAEGLVASELGGTEVETDER